METKENLRKELENLTVKKVEITKNIAELLESAENLLKGKQMKDIVEQKELKDKLKELERRRKKLVKTKGEVECKWKEVLIKYQDS